MQAPSPRRASVRSPSCGAIEARSGGGSVPSEGRRLRPYNWTLTDLRTPAEASAEDEAQSGVAPAVREVEGWGGFVRAANASVTASAGGAAVQLARTRVVGPGRIALIIEPAQVLVASLVPGPSAPLAGLLGPAHAAVRGRAPLLPLR